MTNSRFYDIIDNDSYIHDFADVTKELKDVRIPVITEPNYGASSIWCAETRAGIRAELTRKKYTAIEIDGSALADYDFAAEKIDMVVLIGSSPSFVPSALELLRAKGIEVVLVSYQPPEYISVKGVLRIDYTDGVRTLLRHFEECGCSRVALYGSFSNSSADRLKRHEFLIRTGGVCFDNQGSLEECYRSFFPRWKDFDAVLCVNDMAAASLIHHLRRDGIRIPEELQIACFGSSQIARLSMPSLTSLTLECDELGKQAVSIYAYLQKSAPSVSVSVRVSGQLIVRETTILTDGYKARIEPPHSADDRDEPNFYDDKEVKAFTLLENLLLNCDELDKRILSGQLAGSTMEELAESLNLAQESVRYRLRRLLSHAGMETRRELLEFLRDNHFVDVLR